MRRAAALAFAVLVVAAAPAAARPPAGSHPRGAASPFGIAHTQVLDNDRRIDGNRATMWTTNYGSVAFDITNLTAGLFYPRGSGKSPVFASGLWLGCMVAGVPRAVVADYEAEYGPGNMIGGTFDDPARPEYVTYKVVRYTGNPADSAHVNRTAPELAQDPTLDPVLHHSWSEYLNGAATHGAPTRTYRLPNTSTPAPGDSVDVTGPDVTGDMMLWSVFNDADPLRHTAIGGGSPPLGVEIQQKTFAFDRSDPLGRTVFLEYTVINKGSNLLQNAYLSLWCDPDIGSAFDDVVGCDTTLDLGYAYNSTSTDDIYGSTPPALGYLLLQGPRVPTDVNLRANSFIAYGNGADPDSAPDTYNSMRGLHRDGTSIVDPNEQTTTFMLAGDPLNGTGWIDTSPSDGRMLLSTGPVTIAPGDTQTVVAAIVIGQGTGNLGSVANLRCAAEYVRRAFKEGFPATTSNQDCPGALAPIVTDVTPLSGAKSAPITISGENFSPTPSQNLVRIGGVEAVPLTASRGQITALIPPGASYGPVSVTVAGREAQSPQSVVVDFPHQVLFDAASFTQLSNLGTSGLARTVAIGDIDASGGPDLVVLVSSPPQIVVFRNVSTAGTFTFVPSPPLSVVAGGTSLALGDLDGDGQVDITVDSPSAGNVSVFRNTSVPGLVSFAARQDFPTAPLASGVALGDLDGDGKPEIVGDGGRVLRNTSAIDTLRFAAPQLLPLGPGPFAIGDLDGDGRPDMAAIGSAVLGTITIARNTGRPGVISFASGPTLAGGDGLAITMVDLNGDAKPDLVGMSHNDSLFAYRNTSTSGAISFGARDYFGGSSQQTGLAVASMNGDSLPDLVASNANNLVFNALRVLVNSGFSGSFGTVILPASPVSSVAVADLDRDGKPDLAATASGANAVGVWRNITADYLIGAIAGPNGTISPSGLTGVLSGTNLSFVISPSPGYRVAVVRVDDVSVGALTAYTFTNITANHTITATFTLVVPTDFVVRNAFYVADGPVRATALSPAGDVLYIGGDFTQVGPATGGGVPIDSVNGTFPSSFPRVAGQVHAIVSDGAGGWFIGGNFTGVGGVPRSNIAHIQPDGTLSPWNPGADNVVSALAVSGPTVYAGGSFLTLGGQPRSYLGAIDGVTGAVTTWDAHADGVVYALATDGSTVYAGGLFTHLGEDVRNYLGALDANGSATAWNPSADNLVLTLAVSGLTVYAGGGFNHIGGQTRTYLAALDNVGGLATSWNPAPNAPVHALAPFGSLIYAGGAFTFIGSQPRNHLAAIIAATGLPTTFWNPNANDIVRGIAVGGAKVYVAGDFTTIGFQPRNRLAAVGVVNGVPFVWNPNANAPAYAIAVNGSTVFTGGDFTSIGGQARSRLAAINVASGIVTPWSPVPNNTVRALATSGSTIYIGGDFTTPRSRAMAYDANGSALPWIPNADNTVRALAVSGGTVYAGGDFTAIGGVGRFKIAALDASTGAAQVWNPGVTGRVNVLAVGPAGVYAGGAFTTIGRAARNNLAVLDPVTGDATGWNPPGANGPVNAILVAPSAVYVGGAFSALGGRTQNFLGSLGVLTGTVGPWNPNVDNPVEALALAGPNLHAGGAFIHGQGLVRNCVAAFDTGTAALSNWNPNANFPVHSLSANGFNVFAGGDFTRMGDQPQSYVAEIVPTTLFTIVATAGPHGAISPNGAVQVALGQSQLFTVAPSPGYVISDVRVDGASVGPVAQYTFTNVQAAHTITATFSATFFTIDASAGPHGTITPSGPTLVDPGTDQAFLIAPDASYHVANVLVDGSSVGPVTAFTFTNVQADHTIFASFAPDSGGPPPSTAGAFLLASHGFDDPQGGCRPRGWIAQDLASRVYAHVDDRFLVHDAFISMGTRALWVGADSSSAPDEVAFWVVPEGYGNGWSQRLTSSAFSLAAHPRAVLRFDASIELGSASGLVSNAVNEFVGVQGLRADGIWTFLTGRRLELGAPPVLGTTVTGRGAFKYEVRPGLDGNQTIPLAEPLQLRIVTQTDASGSNEDGGVPPGSGAAVIDNVTVRDSLLDLATPVDFEAGGTGAWTLSAVNGAYGEGPPQIIRDVPAPATQVALRKGFDPADPSCVWTFTSAGDSLPSGVYARITSPWFALAARDSQVLISFAERLNTIEQRRVLEVAVRGKRIGDLRPRQASPPRSLLTGGAGGGDPATAFVPERVLAYPDDFQLPGSDDSIQVVITVEDRGEAGGGLEGRPTTRLPFLDDLRIYQTLADSDHDGVANVVDRCPLENASGQDADGDGCVDSTATLRHVESWSVDSHPVHYVQSQKGPPAILDGSEQVAVRAGFNAWSLVDGAEFPVEEDPPTPQTQASELDGINLVTWNDADFQFPPNVLAVTPTTSLVARGVYDDRVARPGEIVDADVIFNPTSDYGTLTHAGAHDVQSIATHEAGHFLGLTHSGVLDATMFFVLQPGTGALTLTADDAAAVAAAYPSPTLATRFGSVTGRVFRGETGQPLPGALVTAVRLGAGGAPADTVSSDFSREDGRYSLWRLGPGSYSVRTTPLDGNVGGYPLTPEYISTRLDTIARTDFQAEWWSQPESNHDDPSLRGVLTLIAGAAITGIDVITNVDTLPPSVVSVLPAPSARGVGIDAPIVVRFSEAIDPKTLTFETFRLERTATLGQPLSGGGQLVRGVDFIFTPRDALGYGNGYQLTITTGLRDLHGLSLASPFTTTFTTDQRAALALSDLQPRTGPIGSILTLTGSGFDPHPGAVNKVLFTVGSGTRDSLNAVQVTPTSMVVTVPANAVTGPVVVVGSTSTGAVTSNPVTFNVVPLGGPLAPIPVGTRLPLGFAPTDVALSPDGTIAWIVGDGGLASVDLSAPGRPITVHSTIAAGSIALTPDGRRALLTRPSRGEVVAVDAVRGNATFGQPLVPPIASLGSPGGVAVSPDGRRAFVTDALDGMVRVLDIDLGGLTPYTQRHQVALDGTALSGGLAFDPRGNRLYLASSNRGLIALDLATDSSTVLNSNPSSGGVAVPPNGAEALAPGGSRLTLLLTASLAGSATDQINLGGNPRDVAIHPQGRAALVVNAVSDELQVVDLDPTSNSYHRQVARVATGRSPVAISVSVSGSLVAVANYGDRSVSFYSTRGADASLQRVVPEVASPGDLVAVETANPAYVSPTQVDLGSGLFPASYLSGQGVGFAVPSQPIYQRTAQLTLQDPTGTRSLSLPFSVVDRIEGLDPKGPPIPSGTRPADCATTGTTAGLRISPDGRVIALARGLSGCPTAVDFYRASADGANVFAAFLGRTQVSGTLADIGFSPDSKRLFVAVTGATLRAIDADPASPNFTQLLSPISGPLTSNPTSIATDPLGRFVLVGGTPSGAMVTLRTSTGTFIDTVLTATNPRALAVTGDGHYVVAGMTGRAQVIDLLLRRVIATTPNHSGITGPLSVAVTANGKRAAGLFANSTVAVWNLDPAAGAIGSELFFGTVFTGGTLSRILPAPDGDGLLAGCSNSPVLVKIEPGVVPPAAQAAALGQTSAFLARSSDGRRLWVAGADGTAGFGRLSVFNLGDATGLDLISGGGQVGSGGATLPLPIQVRLRDAAGRPQVGAVVTFELQGGNPGALDGLAVTTLRRVTDILGEAGVKWTLGGTPGASSLRVTALGVAETLAVAANAAGDDASIVPQVIQLGPSDGARAINAGTAVFARFNQPMNTADLVKRLTLTTASGPVTGSFAFGEQGRVLLFRPDLPLPFAGSCVLKVAAGALDLDGQATLADAVSTFTVENAPTVSLVAIAPVSGVAGTTVALEGEGFSPVAAQDLVLFNGKLAQVARAGTASLVTSVPIGAVTGPVTVTVGPSTSNPVTFNVLPPAVVPAGAVATIPTGSGLSDIAITPDGRRAYITSPSTHTVVVVNIPEVAVVARIAVGLDPQGIAILPDGKRAYVANTGSNDVSEIDIDPASRTYNTVIHTIPVDKGPVDLVASAVGPRVYVVNAGAGTVNVIDANVDNGTYDQVVTTVNTGSGSSAITVTPDATRLYVGNAAGVVMVDLGSLVVTTVNTGSGASAITITPDATLVLALLRDGRLVVIDAVPGSATFNQVVTTVNTGSGASAITITPDASLAYVTSSDGNTVLVYHIEKLNGAGAVTILPGAAVRLTLVATIPVDNGPADIAIDPSHGLFALVANEASGTVVVLGFPNSLPSIPVGFDLATTSLNLRSMGRWITVHIEPEPPYRPEDIVIASTRINDVVAPDPEAPYAIEDYDQDGRRDLTLKFDRAQLQLTVTAGDRVPVRTSGVIGTRAFEGTDTVMVKSVRVTHPDRGEVVDPLQPYTVRWENNADNQASWVALLHSLDHGRTWTLDAKQLPNKGYAQWTPPIVVADSVRVAVVLIESSASDSSVTGVLGVSEYFRITTATGVELPPLQLTFAPIHPMPSVGSTRFRFGLPRACPVDLALYDVQGRRLVTLASGEQTIGWHEVTWNGRTDAGGTAGAGVYFARFRAEGREMRQRLIWMR